MPRKGLKTRYAVLRILLSLCLLGALLSVYHSWVQLFAVRAQVEEAYQRELYLQQQFCNASLSTSVSQLFFKTCHVDTHSHLRSPFRVAPNFTCCAADPSLPEGNRGTEPCKAAGDGGLDQPCGEGLVVPRSRPVFTVPFQDPCLKRYIEDRCYWDGLPVPKVVHYVWFSNHSLDVVTMLSVLAAYRFVDPCLILFHADSLPQGPNWTALLSLVPVVVVVRRTAPSTVFGRTLGAVQHKSDIARLEALKEYGGIYLDGDQVVVRNLDDFRTKEFVMGHENARNLANSLLISVPGAKFIDIWYRNYRSYNPRQWGIHSTFLPLALARIYPNLIHNAGYAFIKPDLPGIWEVWEGHYDWSSNHAVHLYYRSMVANKPSRSAYTLAQLTQLQSSLGDIARLVWEGHYDWSSSHAVHLYYRSMVANKPSRSAYTLAQLTQLQSSLGDIARLVVFGSKDACLYKQTSTRPVPRLVS